MNNKELISELGTKLGVSQKNAGNMLKSFVELLSEQVIEGNQVHFFNVGMLEKQYKEQRISVNPNTKKRFLVPPKMVVDLKIASTFKNYLKTLTL